MAFDNVEDLTRDRLIEALKNQAMAAYAHQEEEFGEQMREIERIVLLQTVDTKWDGSY